MTIAQDGIYLGNGIHQIDFELIEPTFDCDDVDYIMVNLKLSAQNAEEAQIAAFVDEQNRNLKIIGNDCAINRFIEIYHSNGEYLMTAKTQEAISESTTRAQKLLHILRDDGER